MSRLERHAIIALWKVAHRGIGEPQRSIIVQRGSQQRPIRQVWRCFYCVGPPDFAVDGFDGDNGGIVLTIILDVPKLGPLTLLPSGERQIRIEGDPGCPYNVEGSSDLLNWAPIPATQSSDGILQFTDPEGGNIQRFYRVTFEP